jgi:hypothetical protein
MLTELSNRDEYRRLVPNEPLLSVVWGDPKDFPRVKRYEDYMDIFEKFCWPNMEWEKSETSSKESYDEDDPIEQAK